MSIAELGYIMQSSVGSIYIHQHKEETNRVKLSFFAENSDLWKLIGKNEGITIEENFEIDYRVVGASILNEDKSKKFLIYREFFKIFKKLETKRLSRFQYFI